MPAAGTTASRIGDTPRPSTTHDDLVARAQSLLPQLRENTAEAERMRKMAPASVEAVRKAGLLKVLQASRYGGHQQSLRTHIDTIATVGRGCSATAWCMGVIQAHSWLMAHFPKAAQDETYGANPDTIISAVILPRGQIRQVKEGYVLNGVWPFASGSQYADWLLLGGAVLNAKDEVIDEADVLVPVSDVTIKDDWNVVGLRGTGSCTVVAKDVRIPAHRYLSLRGLIGGDTPGIDQHDGWLYKSAAVPVLTLALAPCGLGIARSALDAFIQRLPGREVAYTDREVQMDMPVTHLQVAEASTKIDAAETLLHRVADDVESAARKGGMMEFKRRARARADIAFAVRQCLEAVEVLYLASGGSGIVEGSTLGRAWRDMHAVSMHGMLNLQTNMEMYGRVVLELKPNTPLI